MKKSDLKQLVKEELQSILNEGKTRWKAKITLTPKNKGPYRIVNLYYEKNSKPTKVDPFWKKEVLRQWKHEGNNFMSYGDRENMGGIKSIEVGHIYDSDADSGMADIYSKKRKGGGYGYAGD
jgi:hypothetical protein